MNKWKILKELVDYSNPYFKVLKKELEFGDHHTNYYILDRISFGVAVPVLADEFVMISQYRFPIQRESLEFPMGGVNPKESLKNCAIRELGEEAGFKPNKITYLGQAAVTPGHSAQSFEAYLMEELQETEILNRDKLEEDMQVKKIKISEFPKLVQEGVIIDGPTLAAYALFQIHMYSNASS